MTPAPESDDDSTGLPALRSWRGVYLVVLACFVATVLALTIFTAAFSG